MVFCEWKGIRQFSSILPLSSPSLPLFSQTKVNNQGQIGVSYAQDLRSGVKLTLSGMLEGRNVQAGGHKFGLALDFESWHLSNY